MQLSVICCSKCVDIPNLESVCGGNGGRRGNTEREKGRKGREEMERGKGGKCERQVKHYSEVRK